MQNKHKLLNAMAFAIGSSVSAQASATLPTNAILKFDAFTTTTTSSSSSVFVTGGSYFGMDTNGNGTISKNERVGLVVNAGITLGKAQGATGTHSGAPDGTESPGLDLAWGFFGNTGLHLTSIAPSVLSDDSAGGVTLDLSGWVVTWNGIDSIPMASGAWDGNADGVAIVSCDAACADGDRFVLDYSATVPVGDPSGFGGVQYALRLEGDVTVPASFTVDSGASSPGSIAQSAGSTDGRISYSEFLNNGGVADVSFTYAGGLLDFVVTGITGTTVAVVIPQTAPIAANAVYRKFNTGVWTTFMDDGTNLIASAPSVSGVCPVVNDVAYNHANGLVVGDDCVQLIIQDGGPYDADATAANIADPGGVATPEQVQNDTRTSGTSGCSITGSSSSAMKHADWWLVTAFIGLLGWFSFKREDRSSR